MTEPIATDSTSADSASPHRTRPARLLGIAALGVLLLVVLVVTYSNHFDNEFHFDDSHVMEQNGYIRDLGNIPEFFTEPESLSTLPTNRTYRPVLLTTYAIDYWAGDGLDPFAFHVTGFAILVAVGVLMVFLFRRLMDAVRTHPANLFVAMLLAGWYALHTANAETINYISARSDSLSTLFVLAALVVWIYASGWKRHLALAFIVLGVLTKANAIAVVPIMLSYELFFVKGVGLRAMFAKEHRQDVVRALLRILPAGVVTVAALALAWAMTPDTFDAGAQSAWSYAITQPFVLLRYAWTFFVPVGLSADTDWTVLDSLVDPRVVVGLAFVLGGLALAVVTSAREQLRPVAFGILWFFLTLAWSSSVIPRAEVTNDHRMFFPFVGLTLAVGWALTLVAYRNEERIRTSSGIRAAIVLAVAVVLSAHALGTWQRNQVWDTEETLWRDVTLASPQNGRGLMNYGLTQMAEGRYEIALDYFEQARRTAYGDHPYLLVNLAIAQNGLGRNRVEVETLFRAAIAQGDAFPATYYHYASWLADEQRPEEALALLERLLTVSPGHEPGLALRSQVEALLIDPLTAAEQAVAADSTPENLLTLSLRYYEAERYNDSLAAATQAIALDPRYAPAHNNVCAAYNALSEYEKAVDACRTALELDPDLRLAQGNLDWALTQLGEPAE